jgi:hypothetical protein
MRQNSFSNPTKAESLRRQLSITAKQLLSLLDDFWQEHKQDIDPHHTRRLQAISLSTPSYLLTEHEVELPWFSCTQPFAFKSPSNAYITSMYDAGKLIVMGYLAAASSAPTSHDYEKIAITHGSSILAAAAYCKSQAEANVSFSMVFPLKLICLLAPSEGQRRLARSVLLKWGEERGLADICQVAAPSYLDRSHG